ncbi:MAG: hypothetical protein Fur0017_28590 [Anaerolineales bacterium]
MQPLNENGSSLYYYVDGQRVYLTPSLEWVSVKFVNEDKTKQEAVTGKFSNTVDSLDGARAVPHLGLTLLPVKDGISSKTFVQGVNAMRSDRGSFSQVNPVYSYGKVDMVVSDEFVAAFRPETSMAEIEAFNAAYGVELVSPIIGQANTFVLRITSESSLDALAMANQYHESGFVLFAAPNFVRLVTEEVGGAGKPNPVGPMFTPNDTYYSPDQWHLHNVGQFGGTTDADIDAPEAWNITLGLPSVVIAVIDEGVDLTHADLYDNMVTGYDATGLGSAGAPTGNDAHGTAVAGLAAAVGDNSLGVSGVCPNCSIMPIRIAYDDGFGNWVYTDAWLANAISWAYMNGADILNNSWGGGSAATVVNTAITDAVTNGRSGLGSVVVFSAGNDNASTVSWPASQSNVIAVGASNQCDQRKTPTNNTCNGFEDWWGSNYGSALDVVAPGVWLTSTDITGTAGYNDGSDPDYTADYTGYMNGTSGAAPIVSGVIGLMMSVNSYMPADGLQDLLEQSTDDLSTVGWDNETGYGRVNALNAVQAAQLPDLVITGYELRNADKSAVITQPNPNETFWVRMTVENRGGNSNNFYPSVYLDDKPNYGPDHDASGIPGYPVNLVLGEVTDYQGYKITGTTALSGTGCHYYDPANLVDPTAIEVESERGNYHPIAFLPGLSAGASTIVDVEIAYPDNGFYPEDTYGSIRTGLPSGAYNLYLYIDSNCLVDESLEDNNQYGPVAVNIGTQVDVTIGTSLMGSYFVPPQGSKRVNYTGVDSGPVVVESNNGTPIIAALRDAYFVTGQLESFVQLMGLPAETLSTTYYFPAYNNVTLDGQLRFGNVGNAPTTVTVTIAGVVRGSYDLNPGQAKRVNYAGLDAGPVVVQSSGGVPIIAALRDAYYVDGRLESFAQLMGLPAENLSTTYYFPAYNNNTLDGQLRFGNVGNAPTTVTVTIAGVVRGTYNLNPSEAKRVNYAGLDAGPVVIQSSGGVPIIAALRDAYFVDGKLVSFVQLMGLPQEQISTTYNFPAYNNVTLDGQLRFGNVGNASTTVTVTIAGVVRGTYNLNPSEAKRVNYAGLDAGPVVIQSSGGVPIIAALRDAYFVNGKVESFAQLMGLPQELLSTAYYFPAYNNVTLDGQLRFGVP